MDFDDVLSKLFNYYNVSSITDFANSIGAERSTVNGWKSRKALGTMLEYINSRDSKAMEYIYTPSYSQTIQTISNGQNAQTVHRDMISGSNPKEDNLCKDIDTATLSLFIEAYQKAKDKNDLKGFRVHLMDY
ncbi:hypothetical protein [Arcobacter sp. FWKO B]|uniref:hypothetical protein n=1 Tax=Arcobacter sp. FWKO B TaxID=2593672 RepID=UPI0018A3C13D|nr:hypothetical protein [Arcobacter sp. FWKO B]QOG13051.1 hypothetical protein FWKOB_10275 [Arcobacter sp. FWKO B]